MTDQILEKLTGVLSNREIEVFKLIGEGKSTANIAEQFQRSIKTIETYRSRIKSKLSLKHNKELIDCAVRWLRNEDLQIASSKQEPATSNQAREIASGLVG